MHIGGIILCGGQSSRMGRPKAWLPVGDETMLAHVVRILSAVIEPIVVVAAPEQDVPALPANIQIVRDPERGRGPLQGLAAGLRVLQGRVEAAYASSCDVPLLRAAFVKRMIDLLGDATIAVPEVGGYRHPLAAVYRPEVATVAEELLAENRLRPVFLYEQVPTRIVTEKDLIDVDPHFDSLRNVNTPQEYEVVLGELGIGSSAEETELS